MQDVTEETPGRQWLGLAVVVLLSVGILAGSIALFFGVFMKSCAC
ncbi:MAG: hypothetical protein QOI92_746 [Chloroflexota bacterium]|jgi:hypothetical protein|nr:hypothetical protein [Chloroflexota bacterium]